VPGDRPSILYYDLEMEKIQGVPVTDEMIEEWADEAEKGYDVDRLRKRGRKPMGDGPAQVVTPGAAQALFLHCFGAGKVAFV